MPSHTCSVSECGVVWMILRISPVASRKLSWFAVSFQLDEQGHCTGRESNPVGTSYAMCSHHPAVPCAMCYARFSSGITAARMFPASM